MKKRRKQYCYSSIRCFTWVAGWETDSYNFFSEKFWKRKFGVKDLLCRYMSMNAASVKRTLKSCRRWRISRSWNVANAAGVWRSNGLRPAFNSKAQAGTWPTTQARKRSRRKRVRRRTLKTLKKRRARKQSRPQRATKQRRKRHPPLKREVRPNPLRRAVIEKLFPKVKSQPCARHIN